MNEIISRLKADFNLKGLIQQYVPISATLLSTGEWTNISNRYNSKVESVLQEGRINSFCLIDYIIGTQQNNSKKAEDCKIMLSAIKEEIEKAISFANSKPEFQREINNKIRMMITSMDTDIDSNNSDFKNWINELFVFNKLSECFVVKDIEKRISNNKSIDYVAVSNKTNEEMYIDVVTYQNIDPTQHNSNKTFNKFINERIKQKYNSKMEGITEHITFRVLPVIEYQEGMEKFKIKIDKQFSLLSLPPQTVGKTYLDGQWKSCIVATNDYLKQMKSMQLK